MGVRRRRGAAICAAALVAGCGGGSDGMSVSLSDVDPAGFHWEIRATCQGGDLDVEFRPGEQVAVPGFARASGDEIAVECGEPLRVTVTNEELRRRGENPTGADLEQPTSEATELSCLAEGPVVVSAHPVWASSGPGAGPAHDIVAGGALRIERGGDTILFGAIGREDYRALSQLLWWRAVCRR
jgi:hypothetical protein